MARPIKQGLDYFPIDVDFFTDDKIRFIETHHGKTGLIVIIKLLCRIYRNGFFTKWDQDEIATFSKYDAMTPKKLIEEIVQEALRRDFFCKDLFDKFSILSSRGIQKRFFTAIKQRKKIQVDFRYLLINLNEYGISIEVNPELTPFNSEIIPQRKGKENKENEERNKINISLSQFYNNELSKLKDIKIPAIQAYSKLVDFILGSNDLNLPLNGLVTFNDQLSFEQFTKLWDNNCSVVSRYQDALLRINDNINYQKGTSLFVRLKTWFDQERDKATLSPNIKQKKVLTS